MNNKLTLLLLAPALFSGCEAYYDPARSAAPALAAKALYPGLYSANHAAGEPTRTPAHFTSYTVGRYVDAADPDIMHESHLVYRKESNGGWNLLPRANSNSALAEASAPALQNPSHSENSEERPDPQVLAALLEQNEQLAKQLAKFQGQSQSAPMTPGSSPATHE